MRSAEEGAAYFSKLRTIVRYLGTCDGNMEEGSMLLTGVEDYRTPISESEQFYQALKLRGIDTALVRVPGSSHGIAGRPSRLIGKIEHILAWFERYKGDDAEE